MSAESDLKEARSEARVILELRDEDVAKMFFEKTMRRNLSRTVRHLDRLMRNGSTLQIELNARSGSGYKAVGQLPPSLRVVGVH